MNEKDPLKSGAMESSLWELNVILFYIYNNYYLVLKIYI